MNFYESFLTMFITEISINFSMNYNKNKKIWLEEETAFFKGWDFSRLHGRMESEKSDWDYSLVVKKYIKNTHILLDMGTGGGELLLSLGHPHNLTHITESYPPNLELCKKTLAPLGICVKQILNDEIPYKSGMFDIVINHHESFNAEEVNRVLKIGGVFITQQVGGENDKELRKALCPTCENKFIEHTLKNNVSVLKKAKFEILFQDECFPKNRFFDVGAIVYFAKIIEWEFPNFSVKSHCNQLYKLQEKIDKLGFIENTEHRFIIAAQKII